VDSLILPLLLDLRLLGLGFEEAAVVVGRVGLVVGHGQEVPGPPPAKRGHTGVRQPPCGWCSSSFMNVLPSAGIGFAFRMRAMCTTLCAIQRVVRFV